MGTVFTKMGSSSVADVLGKSELSAKSPRIPGRLFHVCILGHSGGKSPGKKLKGGEAAVNPNLEVLYESALICGAESLKKLRKELHEELKQCDDESIFQLQIKTDDLKIQSVVHILQSIMKFEQAFDACNPPSGFCQNNKESGETNLAVHRRLSACNSFAELIFQMTPDNQADYKFRLQNKAVSVSTSSSQIDSESAVCWISLWLFFVQSVINARAPKCFLEKQTPQYKFEKLFKWHIQDAFLREYYKNRLNVEEEKQSSTGLNSSPIRELTPRPEGPEYQPIAPVHATHSEYESWSTSGPQKLQASYQDKIQSDDKKQAGGQEKNTSEDQDIMEDANPPLSEDEAQIQEADKMKDVAPTEEPVQELPENPTEENSPTTNPLTKKKSQENSSQKDSQESHSQENPSEGHQREEKRKENVEERIDTALDESWYFAFGSNMNPQRMTKRQIHYKSSAVGVLEHHTLVFNKMAQNKVGIGYANVIPREDGYVFGVLYLLEQSSHLNKLDRFEGVRGRHYRREIVQIKRQDGSQVNATTYIAEDAKTCDGLRPERDYVDNLLKAEDVPDFYMDKLKGVHSAL